MAGKRVRQPLCPQLLLITDQRPAVAEPPGLAVLLVGVAVGQAVEGSQELGGGRGRREQAGPGCERCRGLEAAAESQAGAGLGRAADTNNHRERLWVSGVPRSAVGLQSSDGLHDPGRLRDLLVPGAQSCSELLVGC